MSHTNSGTIEIKFLKDRSKTFEEQFIKLQNSFEPKDFEHLQFMITYDKNLLVTQVFQMLEIIEDQTKQQLINNYSFDRLMDWKLIKLDQKRLRRLTDLLISNKALIVDNVLKTNKALAVVFSLIDLMIRK
jgi:hypothetical protein